MRPLRLLAPTLVLVGSVSATFAARAADVACRNPDRALSAKRAEAVKAWLVAHGVAADRMTTKGYGETEPLVPNKDDESRAKNRRVELRRENCS